MVWQPGQGVALGRAVKFRGALEDVCNLASDDFDDAPVVLVESVLRRRVER